MSQICPLHGEPIQACSGCQKLNETFIPGLVVALTVLFAFLLLTLTKVFFR